MGETAGITNPLRRLARAGCGIEGFDDVLNGGFPTGHLYLLEGEPGSGKTTLALQFLFAGLENGEPGLYVTLSETESELREVIRGHGWDDSGLKIVELERDVVSQSPDRQYTVFESADVELGDTLRAIYEAAETWRPRRVVLDSLSELRLLSRDALRFRRELLGLKQHFAAIGTTVLLLDDRTLSVHEGVVHSIAHGVVRLERMAAEHGAERRRLIVPKIRGSRYREGYHDYRIETGGLVVFPRLVASEHREPAFPGDVLSGVGNLDDLLGGGLSRGTSTIFMGPSGSGKSTLASAYAAAAAELGERTEILLFDENVGTYLQRCAALGIDIRSHIDNGLLSLRQVNPSEISPGELSQIIIKAVDERGAKHLVIDSLNGVMQAMPGERTLVVQLHELLSFLNQKSVNTILTQAQHGLIGPQVASEANLSYLADTLVLLRYFEAFGELRRAISVVKKRTGTHEHSVRELAITAGGIVVGAPLRDFQGVFTGVPHYIGLEAPLIDGSQ